MPAVSNVSTPIEWGSAAAYFPAHHEPTSGEHGPARHSTELAQALPVGLAGPPTRTSFLAMRAAFRPSGGAARGDDLARLLEDSQRGDFVSLARLIGRKELFGFSWCQTYWIPMFQFDLWDLSLRSGPRRVRRELPAEFDGWSLASWFARPNGMLDGHCPVTLLDSNLPAVLEAARAQGLGIST